MKAENSVGFCESVASVRVDVPAPPAPPSPPTSPLSAASPLHDSPGAEQGDADGLVDSPIDQASDDDPIPTSPRSQDSPLPVQLVSDDDDVDDDINDGDADNTQLDCSDDDDGTFGNNDNDGNESVGSDNEALGDGSGDGMFGDLLGGLEPEEGGASLEDIHNGSSDEENGQNDEDEAARPTLLLLPGSENMEELDAENDMGDVNTNDDEINNSQKNLATLCVISPVSLTYLDAGSNLSHCISSALDVDCRAWDPTCSAHSWVRVVSAKESLAAAAGKSTLPTPTCAAAAAAAEEDCGVDSGSEDVNTFKAAAPQSFSLFDLLSPPTAYVASTVAAASAADGSAVSEADVITAAEAASAPPFYQIRVRNVNRVQVQPNESATKSATTPQVRKEVGPWRLIALPRAALASSVIERITTQARSAAQVAAMPLLRADKDGVQFDARLPSPADFMAVRKVRLRPKRAAAWFTWQLLHGVNKSGNNNSSIGGGATAVELQLEDEYSAMINGATSSGVRPTDEVELQIRAFVCLTGPSSDQGSDAWTLEVPLVLANSHQEAQRTFVPATRDMDVGDFDEVEKVDSEHRPPVTIALKLPSLEDQPVGLRYAIAGALAAAQNAWGESRSDATVDGTGEAPNEAKLFCEVSGRLLRGRRQNKGGSDTRTGSSGRNSRKGSATSAVAGPWCVLGAHALRLPPQAVVPPPHNVADAIRASSEAAETTINATGIASLPTKTASGASVSPFAEAAAKWLVARCAGFMPGIQEDPMSSRNAPNEGPSIADENHQPTPEKQLPGALQRYPSTCWDLQRLLIGCAGAMVEADACAAAHALSVLSKHPLLEGEEVGNSMKDGAGLTSEDSKAVSESSVQAAVPMVLGPAFEAALRRRGLLLQPSSDVPASGSTNHRQEPAWLLDAAVESAAMAFGPLGSGAAPDNSSSEALAALIAAIRALAEETPSSRMNTSTGELGTIAQRLQMPVAYTLYATNRDVHGDFAANAAAALELPVLVERNITSEQEGGQVKGGLSKVSQRKATPQFGELPASVSAGLAQWGKGWLRQLQLCATIDLGGESDKSNQEVEAYGGMEGGNASQESAWLLTELMGGALNEGPNKSAVTICMRTRGSNNNGSGSSSNWANKPISEVAEEDEDDAHTEDETKDELNGSMSDVDKEKAQSSGVQSETPVKFNNSLTKRTTASVAKREAPSVDHGTSQGMLAFAISESAFDYSTGPLLSSTGGGGVFYLGLGEVRPASIRTKVNIDCPLIFHCSFVSNNSFAHLPSRGLRLF